MIVRESRDRANRLGAGDPLRPKLGIAAQAIGVVALGAIVYFAFLSPDDSGPLSGIDVQPPVEGQPPERQAGKSKKSKPQSRRSRLAAASPSRPILPGSVPTEGLPPVDSPAGSQYAGTVARILGQLGHARH